MHAFQRLIRLTRLTRLVAAGTLALCAAGTALADTRITVGFVPIADLMPLYVAKEQGFFAKRGLDVTLQAIPINPTIPPALQSDSIQVGTVTPSVLMQAADSGMDLVVIAGGSVLTPASKTPGIVLRNGVALKTPQDFIGKKVGVAGLGATLHVLARKWFADHGVDPKKVNFVEVALPQMSDVLKGGSVDAVVPTEPFLSRIVQSGAGSMFAYLSDDFPAAGVMPIAYGVTRDWLQKNTAAARAFREALEESNAFHAKNEAAARADMAKYVKAPPDVFKALIVPQQASVATEDHMRFWIDVMKSQDMLKNSVDAKRLIFK